jgi:hypothetical protein
MLRVGSEVTEEKEMHRAGKRSGPCWGMGNQSIVRQFGMIEGGNATIEAISRSRITVILFKSLPKPKQQDQNINERGKRRAGVANDVGSGSEGDKPRKSDAGRHVKKLHHHHTKGTSSVFYF